MNKMIIKLGLGLMSLALLSCATTSSIDSKTAIRIPDTISEEIPESELAKIEFDKFVYIYDRWII